MVVAAAVARETGEVERARGAANIEDKRASPRRVVVAATVVEVAPVAVEGGGDSPAEAKKPEAQGEEEAGSAEGAGGKTVGGEAEAPEVAAGGSG